MELVHDREGECSVSMVQVFEGIKKEEIGVVQGEKSDVELS